MPKSKIAITIEAGTLRRLDRLVREHTYSNRSQAVQQAVDEKLARLDRSRLARECAKLEPLNERSMADEGLSEDLAEWPEY